MRLGSRFSTYLVLAALSAGLHCAEPSHPAQVAGPGQSAPLAASSQEQDAASLPVAESASAEPQSADPSKPIRIETIGFPASDGLEVSAELYLYHPADAPFVVLFHQAGFSRGEYQEIAPRLGTLGFNAMAVDQRSGGAVSGVANLTQKRAVAQKRETEFLDALPDMRAALGYVAKHYPKAKRIAWGSSYSAALVLYLAGSEPALVQAALAFSPGEYFAGAGKGKGFIADAARSIEVPSFITSAKAEEPKWRAIADAMATAPTRYLPKGAGHHGSRALWTASAGHEGYWRAVEAFLMTLK